jgi:hypothetical protein
LISFEDFTKNDIKKFDFSKYVPLVDIPGPLIVIVRLQNDALRLDGPPWLFILTSS